VAQEQTSPALLGWAFELGFFVEIEQAARLRRSVQVKVCGSGNNVQSCPAMAVSTFEPKEFKVPGILGAWARLIAWNQRGYEAVLLTSVDDGKVTVHVAQVTAGITHSLEFNDVESLLQRVGKEGFEVKSVDVVFVVRRAIAFQAGPISATTLLWGFRVRVVELY
jgi:hypothetical protein